MLSASIHLSMVRRLTPNSLGSHAIGTAASASSSDRT
jgi:hypothetical protein